MIEQKSIATHSVPNGASDAAVALPTCAKRTAMKESATVMYGRSLRAKRSHSVEIAVHSRFIDTPCAMYRTLAPWKTTPA